MGAPRVCLNSGRIIAPEEPTLVVAEIGQNHNGRLALAEQLIDAAAWAGADAVKLVKRDLDCELSREARQRPYCGRHSYGKTYGEHRRALELSPDDHARLRDRAREHGLLYFATASDPPSADLIAQLGADVLKVASRDVSNGPLLEYLARLGRPVFLSTGMSSFEEIDAAIETLRRYGTPLVVMQCTSLYPAPIEQTHLRSIATLAERYRAPVGFSDHTPGTRLAPVAVALGARVVEKHLTLDRRLKGTDHACSLQPEQLRRMISAIRDVEAALGRDDKPVPEEVRAVRSKLGRSLVARVDLPAGARLHENAIELKCPGDGLTWAERELVLGRTLKRPIRADEKLSIEDFE